MDMGLDVLRPDFPELLYDIRYAVWFIYIRKWQAISQGIT